MEKCNHPLDHCLWRPSDQAPLLSWLDEPQGSPCFNSVISPIGYICCLCRKFSPFPSHPPIRGETREKWNPLPPCTGEKPYTWLASFWMALPNSYCLPGNFFSVCVFNSPLSGHVHFFFLFSLGLHLQHMEVLRLGVELELQLPAYTVATATWDPSHVWDLHHSSWQHRIPSPLERPGIEPTSSWILVKFVSPEPQRELLVTGPFYSEMKSVVLPLH